MVANTTNKLDSSCRPNKTTGGYIDEATMTMMKMMTKFLPFSSRTTKTTTKFNQKISQNKQQPEISDTNFNTSRIMKKIKAPANHSLSQELVIATLLISSLLLLTSCQQQVAAQCPWTRDLVALHSDCICDFNPSSNSAPQQQQQQQQHPINRMSVQCSLVNFQQLLTALKQTASIELPQLLIKQIELDNQTTNRNQTTTGDASEEEEILAAAQQMASQAKLDLLHISNSSIGRLIDNTFIMDTASFKPLISSSATTTINEVDSNNNNNNNNNSRLLLLDGRQLVVAIQSLHLSRCGIEQIESGAFNGLEWSLTSLSLSDNQLEFVPIRALHRLSNLKVLDLSNNRLTQIQANTFITLNKLATLRLADNRIGQQQQQQQLNSNDAIDNNNNNSVVSTTQAIDNQAFCGLESSLSDLNLKNTQLSAFPLALKRLKSLAFLNLAQNQISNLPPKSFEQMNSLTAINLERNRISHIEKDTFFGVEKSLSSLSLLGNLIELFPSNELARLDSLRRLDLGFNGIECLPLDAFASNKKLILIALDGNPLETLPEEAFKPLEGILRGMSIGGRALNCDCRLSWILRWQLKFNIQISSRERQPQFCAKPHYLRSIISMSSLRPEHLSCSSLASSPNPTPYFPILQRTNVTSTGWIAHSSSLSSSSSLSTATTTTTTTSGERASSSIGSSINHPLAYFTIPSQQQTNSISNEFTSWPITTTTTTNNHLVANNLAEIRPATILQQTTVNGNNIVEATTLPLATELPDQNTTTTTTTTELPVDLTEASSSMSDEPTSRPTLLSSTNSNSNSISNAPTTTTTIEPITSTFSSSVVDITTDSQNSADIGNEERQQLATTETLSPSLLFGERRTIFRIEEEPHPQPQPQPQPQLKQQTTTISDDFLSQQTTQTIGNGLGTNHYDDLFVIDGDDRTLRRKHGILHPSSTLQNGKYNNNSSSSSSSSGIRPPNTPTTTTTTTSGHTQQISGLVGGEREIYRTKLTQKSNLFHSTQNMTQIWGAIQGGRNNNRLQNQNSTTTPVELEQVVANNNSAAQSTPIKPQPIISSVFGNRAAGDSNAQQQQQKARENRRASSLSAAAATTTNLGAGLRFPSSIASSVQVPAVPTTINVYKATSNDQHQHQHQHHQHQHRKLFASSTNSLPNKGARLVDDQLPTTTTTSTSINITITEPSTLPQTTSTNSQQQVQRTHNTIGHQLNMAQSNEGNEPDIERHNSHLKVAASGSSTTSTRSRAFIYQPATPPISTTTTERTTEIELNRVAPQTDLKNPYLSSNNNNNNTRMSVSSMYRLATPQSAATRAALTKPPSSVNMDNSSSSSSSSLMFGGSDEAASATTTTTTINKNWPRSREEDDHSETAERRLNTITSLASSERDRDQAATESTPLIANATSSLANWLLNQRRAPILHRPSTPIVGPTPTTTLAMPTPTIATTTTTTTTTQPSTTTTTAKPQQQEKGSTLPVATTTQTRMSATVRFVDSLSQQQQQQQHSNNKPTQPTISSSSITTTTTTTTSTPKPFVQVQIQEEASKTHSTSSNVEFGLAAQPQLQLISNAGTQQHASENRRGNNNNNNFVIGEQQHEAKLTLINTKRYSSLEPSLQTLVSSSPPTVSSSSSSTGRSNQPLNSIQLATNNNNNNGKVPANLLVTKDSLLIYQNTRGGQERQLQTLPMDQSIVESSSSTTTTSHDEISSSNTPKQFVTKLAKSADFNEFAIIFVGLFGILIFISAMTIICVCCFPSSSPGGASERTTKAATKRPSNQPGSLSSYSSGGNISATTTGEQQQQQQHIERHNNNPGGHSSFVRNLLLFWWPTGNNGSNGSRSSSHQQGVTPIHSLILHGDGDNSSEGASSEGLKSNGKSMLLASHSTMASINAQDMPFFETIRGKARNGGGQTNQNNKQQARNNYRSHQTLCCSGGNNNNSKFTIKRNYAFENNVATLGSNEQSDEYLVVPVKSQQQQQKQQVATTTFKSGHTIGRRHSVLLHAPSNGNNNQKISKRRLRGAQQMQQQHHGSCSEINSPITRNEEAWLAPDETLSSCDSDKSCSPGANKNNRYNISEAHRAYLSSKANAGQQIQASMFVSTTATPPDGATQHLLKTIDHHHHHRQQREQEQGDNYFYCINRQQQSTPSDKSTTDDSRAPLNAATDCASSSRGRSTLRNTSISFGTQPQVNHHHQHHHHRKQVVRSRSIVGNRTSQVNNNVWPTVVAGAKGIGDPQGGQLGSDAYENSELVPMSAEDQWPEPYTDPAEEEEEDGDHDTVANAAAVAMATSGDDGCGIAGTSHRRVHYQQPQATDTFTAQYDNSSHQQLADAQQRIKQQRSHHHHQHHLMQQQQQQQQGKNNRIVGRQLSSYDDAYLTNWHTMNNHKSKRLSTQTFASGGRCADLIQVETDENNNNNKNFNIVDHDDGTNLIRYRSIPSLIESCTTATTTTTTTDHNHHPMFSNHLEAPGATSWLRWTPPVATQQAGGGFVNNNNNNNNKSVQIEPTSYSGGGVRSGNGWNRDNHIESMYFVTSHQNH